MIQSSYAKQENGIQVRTGMDKALIPRIEHGLREFWGDFGNRQQNLLMWNIMDADIVI